MCTITISEIINNNLFSLLIGNIVNPPYQISQTIQLRFNYNTNPLTFSLTNLNIQALSFAPGSFTNLLLTQGSQKVGAVNDYTFTFSPAHNIQQNGKIVLNKIRFFTFEFITIFIKINI